MLVRNPVDHGFSGNIAKQFGIPAAMIFHRIVWSINYHHGKRQQYEMKYFLDDQWWMDDTFESIEEHFNGLFSLSTIKRAVKDLETSGVLIGRRMNCHKWDHTKWYAINIAEYEKIENIKAIQSDIDSPKMTLSRKGPNDPIEDIKKTPSSSSNSHTHNPTKSRDAACAADTPISLAIDKKSPLNYTEQDLALAHDWFALASISMKWKKPGNKWNPETFAVNIAKIRKTMGMSIEEMSYLFQFIKKDKFWNDKALSPSSLLKKNADGDRKIDNILIAATKTERKTDKIMAMINSAVDPF